MGGAGVLVAERQAAGPSDPRPGALAGDVRIVRRALARRAGWVRRVVAVLAPRSVLAGLAARGAGRGGSGASSAAPSIPPRIRPPGGVRDDAAMTEETFPLHSADGTALHATWWAPVGPPKATVVRVHGLGEHSGRNAHVARGSRGGYAVAMFDLRGHGESPGGRGHTPFNRTMEDIAACFAYAREQIPDVPRFLYGHSLGGLLVLTYALRLKPDLAGVIVRAPDCAAPSWSSS